MEYALIAAIVALAATAGINTLANDIDTAFTSTVATLNADI